MACKVEEKNGHLGNPQIAKGKDVKIVVVGDKKCGKTKFIKAFAEREGNQSGPEDQAEYVTIYECKYEFKTEWRYVKIYEIPDVDTVDQISMVTVEHNDTNGFVFMYAIDDLASFQMINEKWMQTLKHNKCWRREPAILVGNKRDLREDQQVIQRLARDGQVLVTEEQGKSFAAERLLANFYECLSIDENDQNIHDAFKFVLEEGLKDWIRDESGH